MMEEFLVDLNNEISIQSSVNGETNQDSFFEIISDLLIENGDCKEAQIVNDWNNEKSGIQINGYGGDPLNDENTLSIFLVKNSFVCSRLVFNSPYKIFWYFSCCKNGLFRKLSMSAIHFSFMKRGANIGSRYDGSVTS